MFHDLTGGVDAEVYGIIIVDDELFVRKGLIGMIDWEGSGFRIVDEADNGEDALELIRAKRPQLVITDIRMPVLDGIGLIEAVTEEQLGTEFIIISGYNDFRYAQQAVRYGVLDYVLKPINEHEIVKALHKFRDLFTARKQLQDRLSIHEGVKRVEALIRGEAVDEVLDAWEQQWIEAGSRQFTYVLLEVNNVFPWSGQSMPGKAELKEAIRQAVQQFTAETPIIYEHRRFFGFIVPEHYLANHEGELRSFLEHCLSKLYQRYPLQVQAYAGRPVSTLQELKHSYTSAKQTVEYKYVRPAQPILLSSDIAGLSLNYIHTSSRVFQALIEAIEEGKHTEIMGGIGKLFAEFQEKLVSREAMKAVAIQCVHSVLHTIRSMEGDEKQLASLVPMMNWPDHNITLAELRSLFEAFALEAAERIQELYQSYGSSGLYRIKCYVDRNFHENLNLKQIAGQFYMNSAYLGQVFKKNYGMYFNDYLLQLRITEAKKLLRQTDLRIYEIAEQVGFKNADYFVTQFEKLEQRTPTEYRNRTGNR
ncbi:response regulator [Paenibacillus silagei]|uniref:Two-component system response regulator YesN n=1 Tax=Paenibacillus silagei TaxID=1670801 RepID=A0ABS4NUD1_9BACL|nr:response regulator [Paenibacillus silagei]MBP2113672.1 two-component system response regulator YesN [Paenibacillus silagei]